MIVLTDKSLMPFGKYQGKPMEDVPADYLMWLYDNDKYSEQVKVYIEDNMDVIKKQINER